MVSSEPLVSIIILNLNGKDLILDCLNSIKKNTSYKNYEIIVVDNGSTDSSIKELEKAKKNNLLDKLILNEKNLGFSFANNQGFKASKGDYLFMLNNDTRVCSGWLENAIKLFNADPKIACVGSRLIPNENAKIKYLAPKEVRSVCGAAMIFKKNIAEQIGYLDYKNFSPIYGEEVDWCYRARNLGYKIFQSNDSLVVHLEGVNTKKTQGTNRRFINLEKSRVKAMLMNHSIKEIFLKDILSLFYLFLTKNGLGKNFFLYAAVYFEILKELPYYMSERKKKLSDIKKIRINLANI